MMSPPYIPTVKGKKAEERSESRKLPRQSLEDIANFSPNKEDMPPQIPYKARKNPALLPAA